MKFISSVDQDISRVSETNECMVYPCQHENLLCVYYIKKLPHYLAKIALNHNVGSAMIVTCEIIINKRTCEITTFISGGKINKTVHFLC